MIFGIKLWLFLNRGFHKSFCLLKKKSYGGKVDEGMKYEGCSE
jgi:hypothetical protein